MTWRAMFTAPKDGTIIIALAEDFSMIEAIYFGTHEMYNPQDGWFSATEEAGMIGHDETGWVGWMPCETVPEWEAGIAKATEEYEKTRAKTVES